jgi:hypothetical protein
VVILTFGAVSIYSGTTCTPSAANPPGPQGYLPLTKAVAQIESFQKNRQRDTDRLLEEKEADTRRALIKLARVYFPQLVREKLTAAANLAREARAQAPESERGFLLGLDARINELTGLYEEYEKRCIALFADLEAPSVPDRGSDQARAVASLERKIDREIKVLG